MVRRPAAHRHAGAHRARRGIGRTFQVVKPLHKLTVVENVMLGAFLHTGHVSEAAARAREVLAFLQMDAVADLPAQGLGWPPSSDSRSPAPPPLRSTPSADAQRYAAKRG